MREKYRYTGKIAESDMSLHNDRERCPEVVKAESLKEDLRSETLKWQERAEELFCRLTGDKEILENISAYIRDSHFFLDKGDLIRAFEAVIWAWAWMEIGLERGMLRQ
jgi:hypothetical protein